MENSLGKQYLTKVAALIMSLWFVSCGKASKSETTSIYGQDNRVEVFAADSDLKTLAASVVTLIKSEKISGTTIDGETLGAKLELCETERFREQPAAAACSGFIGGDDLIVTAGHCIKTEEDCANTKVVLDYAYTQPGVNPSQTTQDKIFQCSSIVKTVSGGDDKLDFAVIKLDRAVGRPVLNLASSPSIALNTSVTLIGNSAGLPTKVAESGMVVANSNDVYFEATIDSFGGNSGSPIINAENKMVEGIIVRGKQDFDIMGECTTSIIYDEDTEVAEDVTRSRHFASYLGGQGGGGGDWRSIDFRELTNNAFTLADSAERLGDTHYRGVRDLASRLHYAASDLYRASERAERHESEQNPVAHDFERVSTYYVQLEAEVRSQGDHGSLGIDMRRITLDYERLKRTYLSRE